MPAFVLYFGVSLTRPPDVSGRQWKEANRVGMQAVGTYYDEVIQPRYFQTGADSRYGWKPRTERYLRRKRFLASKSWRVKDGGEKSNVFSGVTRTAVLAKQYPLATPSRVRVPLPTAPYIQMRPRRPNMPAIGRELTTVTDDEAAAMAQVFVAAREAYLNSAS
jgi:hypothetical protein